MTDVARPRYTVPLTGTVAGLLGTAVAAAGASWVASGALLTPRRNPAPPPGRLLGVEPLAGGADRLRVRLTGDGLDQPGTWGVRWLGGAGVVSGSVLRSGDGVTERVLRLLDGTAPDPVRAPLEATWHPYVWDEALPLTGMRTTSVEGPLGGLPAIEVPASRPGPAEGCVVALHGRSARPAQMLRLLRASAAVGWDGLAVAYRNSDGAPATGRYALGGTEWEDVEAAVGRVVAAGYERIVLAGCSMGGAIALSFLRRSPLARRIEGVVLDAPVLDWAHVLRSVSANMRAGRALGLLTPLIQHVAAARGAGDVRTTLEHSVETLEVPTLILHGSADLVTPARTSIGAADARPETIRLHLVPGARHATAWNTDPDGYEAAVGVHLASLAA
jgi:uncharacterized protein